jgi:hypothetical protein
LSSSPNEVVEVRAFLTKDIAKCEGPEAGTKFKEQQEGKW